LPPLGLLVAVSLAAAYAWWWRGTLSVDVFDNDSAFHIEMIQFATQILRQHHDPLTSWCYFEHSFSKLDWLVAVQKAF